ncbi:S8 family serine peptidase, partial [Glaciecola sp. SC05]|uniref:S8 family serine peptidase n=1 Tax=Glaciecola sp. SC05 TaxID=1987355 RepID=UPI003528E3C7
VEDDVDDDAEDDIDNDVEDDAEDDIDNDMKDDADDDIDDDIDVSTQTIVGTTIAAANFENLAQRASQELESAIEQRTEADNKKIFSDDWLILNDPNDMDFLAANGYSIISTRFLPSLNKDLIRVEAPATFKPDVEGEKLLLSLNSTQRAVDFNHIYTLSEQKSLADTQQLSPQKLITIESPIERQRVGVIDTQLESTHPALRSVSITSKDFSENNPISISSHGNSVVSILVGNSDEYTGLLSNVDVYAASVFFDDDTNGQITTTESLIQSLDWLISQDVKVINMSLAGPPNMVLSAAIDKYCEQGVIIVAAVGNSGPHSKPLFPAAYDCVIGVTAISENNLIYRRAVRGKQVDIASYGVNVRAAANNNSYSNVTGTSFATPFVTAQLLSLLPTEPLNTVAQQQDVIDALIALTVDLGEPGKDEIYGHGALIKTIDSASEK